MGVIIILVLPIKKQWFDMIVAGEKLEEYRQLSQYYMTRFSNLFSMRQGSHEPVGLDRQQLILRNGYSSDSPSCIITATLGIGTGRVEWGAVEGEEYYILSIHDVRLCS